MKLESLKGLKTRPVAIPFILICVLVVAGGAWGLSPKQAQQDTPQIQNLTQSLQVVSLERDSSGNAYLLTLKNGYSKNINGYSIGVGSASKLDVDLTHAERVI